MCQLGSCSLYCNTVLHSCVIAYGACTQSRAQYMCGLDSNSVGPSAKPFHSGTVLIFFYVLWNQCGTHQANHSTVEPFPNWLNPLYTHCLQLFLSSSLLVNYSTAAAAPACLMLFSREELGRQTMLAHSRVSSTLILVY